MKRKHRMARWVNTWLPRYGWAIWFERDMRLPDGARWPGTYDLIPEGPIRMRLGRFERD